MQPTKGQTRRARGAAEAWSVKGIHQQSKQSMKRRTIMLQQPSKHRWSLTHIMTISLQV